MNISELILKLSAIKDEHGDIPVLYSDYEQGECDIYDVEVNEIHLGKEVILK